MRYLLTILLFAGLSTLGMAQITVEIPDLEKTKTTTTITVVEASLATVSIPRVRGGGSNDQTVWIITRNQDKYSPYIQDANNRGRAFKNVVIHIGNNQQVLNQALISNYSISAVGTSVAETFYFQFSNN